MHLEPTTLGVILPATVAVGRLLFDWWKWRTERKDRGEKNDPPDNTPTLAA